MTSFTLSVQGHAPIMGDIKLPAPPAPEPYRILRVPDEGRFMFLVEDYKTGPEKWDGKPRSLYLNYKKDPPYNGLPATIPMQKLFYALNEEWQQFLFALYYRACFNSLSLEDMMRGWRNTTRDAGGQFDRHTWNNVKDPEKVYTDYVQGLNLDSPYGDMEQQDLLFERNIVKVLGEDTKGNYIIETLDPLKPPPFVDDVWGKWWLVGWLTISTSFEIGEKEWVVLKWPWLRQFGTPYLVLGRGGTNKVPKYWCKPIENGAEYSPYSP